MRAHNSGLQRGWHPKIPANLNHRQTEIALFILIIKFGRGVRFGLKVGHNGLKWDNPETFSNHIAVHFDSPKCIKILSGKLPLRAKSDITGFDHHGRGYHHSGKLHFYLHCAITRRME